MSRGAEIAQLLGRYKVMPGTEDAMQRGVAEVLDQAGISFEREHRLGPRDRIDFFLTDDQVGIECKIGGSLAEVTRQLQRYALTGQVRELVLLTSRSLHWSAPASLSDVDIHVVLMRWGL